MLLTPKYFYDYACRTHNLLLVLACMFGKKQWIKPQKKKPLNKVRQALSKKKKLQYQKHHLIQRLEEQCSKTNALEQPKSLHLKSFLFFQSSFLSSCKGIRLFYKYLCLLLHNLKKLN